MSPRSEATLQTFLKRHRMLQLRSREVAQEAVQNVTLSEGGIEIDFGPGVREAEAEGDWLEEARHLDIARPAAPVLQGASPPPLEIAILVTGTRGDVQPFVPIGRRLARDGHRVRLATHVDFRDFVESNGLEFYPLAGDPKELIAYMVKTGGKLLPTKLDQIVEDVPKKRQMLREIIESTWGACTQPDPGREDAAPFRADAIIANPPCYGHAHVAEALRIPLQMVFTMPWTPTTAFPQALANVPQGRNRPRENWLSYGVIDLLTWAGVGDLINDFRRDTLGLPALHVAASGASVINDRAVPFCYLWSPKLIPKPADWQEHIDVADFVFFEQESRFEPPPELTRFLEAGDPPIYVGFGSCVVEDPEALTRTVFAALEQAGARGIVSAGWGGLGGGEAPPHVHLIGECPHDWLFPRCAAVCHHGGAGTTATGLRFGRPTVVVPFFGDQPFWGHMVAEAGAGPAPVPAREVSIERLAEAFRACSRSEVRARAEEIGATLRERDGADLAARAFYRHLPTTGDGVLSHLGFHARERERLRAGEIVAVELPSEDRDVTIAVATRLKCSLDAILEPILTGRTEAIHPATIAFGELGEAEPVASAFAGAGFDESEADEATALLRAEPGQTFNLSPAEIGRFAALRAELGSDARDPAVRERVDELLRALLLERTLAYRAGGLDAIAPYAREEGRFAEPGSELRAAAEAASLFAASYPRLHRAFLDYPKSAHPEALHRFHWAKRRVDGRPAFLLGHRVLLSQPALTIMALRSFYVSRVYDGLDLVVALIPEEEELLAVATWRFVAERLRGLGGAVRRPQVRRRARNVLTEHVTAVRRMVEEG
ncbi:MAG: glycosyltransferase [Myxococcota bacterium]|nr:glycosyltransferase [Myxococcota bacterium]